MSRPPRRRRFDPLAAVLVAAGLGGLAVGSALRSGPPPLPAPERIVGVLATVDVIGVVLDPYPVALLDVAVYNGGDRSVRVRQVRVTPPGLPTVTSPADTPIAAQDLAVLQARADLACGPVPNAGGPIGVTVGVDPAGVSSARRGEDPSLVTAVPTGARAQQEACVAARSQVPPAADVRRGVGTLVRTANRVVVQARDLPPGALIEGPVIADPASPHNRLRLNLSRPIPVGPDGTVTVPLTDAAPLCRVPTADWPVLPTGITVTFADSPGATASAAYVTVGPDLARWVRDRFDKACPDAAG